MARNEGGYLGTAPAFDGPNGLLPGAWALQEAYGRSKTGNWAPQTLLFPPAYQTLLNSFVTQRYVSPSGSNSNPGTKTAPWLTLEHAIANTVSGGAIGILPGTYAIANEVLSYSESMLRDDNKALHFIGYPGQVIITESSNVNARDNHMWAMRNTGTRAYGLIIRRNNNGRADSYMTAVFGRDSASVHGQVYNCVFEEVNANGAASFVYDNGGIASVHVERCLFVAGNFMASYSGGSSTNAINNACTSTFATNGASTNNVSNATINSSTYQLTNYSDATYGVYSGTYAWPL